MNEDPQKKDEPFFKDVEFKASYGKADQIPSQGTPQIAFAGRSNAGKSSLLNAILERKSLAKVSSTPGKQNYSISFCKSFHLSRGFTWFRLFRKFS